jgi:hypothetical protein
MRPVRAVEIFCLALTGRVFFMDNFLPSALRWAVTRRPCGAFNGIIIKTARSDFDRQTPPFLILNF